MDSAPSAYEHWLTRREEHITLCGAGGEDRLSALPDDVLRRILGCLDTRTALATAALSKQWARLPRDLSVLQFKVCDVLPERYHRCLRIHLDEAHREKSDYLRRTLFRIQPDEAHRRQLHALVRTLGRYERQSMRSLVKSVTSFLDADNGEARRSVNAMALELFPCHNSAPFNRLIATGVANWGVQDLEVVVLNPTTDQSQDVPTTDQSQDVPTTDQSQDVRRYTFPHHVFEDSKSPLVLKKLKLSNCAPLAARNDGTGLLRKPRAFSLLTVLVLQGMPKSRRIYRHIIQACPMLEVLHLKSCLFRTKITIDAPGSRLKELVIDACTFKVVNLGALPSLERLAWLGAPVVMTFGSLPRLSHLNLSFYDEPNARPDLRYAVFFGPLDGHSELTFSGGFPDLESFVVRYTGPEKWFANPDLHMPLRNVRRLLVADMPCSWDISWTCCILQATPYLETLHVHIDEHKISEQANGATYTQPPSSFKHQVLREVVIIGFHGTRMQVEFVKFLTMTACKTLEKVTLVKYGHIKDKGLWDWEVAASPKACQWSDEQRNVIMREINGGNNPSLMTQIILG